MKNLPERAILSSRFLLLPFFLGLIVALVYYIFGFTHELYLFTSTFWGNPSENVLVGVLNLIDMSMLANLLLLMIVGGYSVFVREIDFTKMDHAPRFVKSLSSGILKVKMCVSLVSISGIGLLKTFLETNHSSWEDLSKKLTIHLAFLLSAFILNKMEVSSHPPEPSHH